MVEIPNKNKRFYFYCHSTQDKYMNVAMATRINAMELRQQHSTYSITADQIERRTKKKKTGNRHSQITRWHIYVVFVR